MKRYGAEIDFGTAPAGTFETLSISLPQGGDVSGSLQVFGADVYPMSALTLRSLEGGNVTGAATFAFDPQNAPKSGANGFMTRTRAVALQGFNGLLDKPAVLPVVEDRPTARVAFTALPLTAELGDDLPNAADCEAEARLGPKTNLTFCREMLAASESVTLFLYPGPGLVVRRVPADYDVTGRTVREVLNDLLLRNGVRWWQEGDILFIDARALPVGELSLTGTDAQGASWEWQDEPRTPEPEPLLQDFLDRCDDAVESSDGESGTFETRENGFLRIESLIAEDGVSVRSWTELTKAGGQIVKEEAGGEGRMPYPNNPGRVGPKYRTLKTKTYHHLVPSALVESVEEVYAHAAYTDLLSGSNVPNYIYTGADLAWPALLAQSPYLTNRTRTLRRWHPEGWLKQKTELKRELVGMLSDRDISESGGIGDPTDSPVQIQFMYRDTVTDTTWTPVGSRRWLKSGQVVETVERPISFAPVGGVGITLVDTVGVGSLTSSLPFSELSETPPETISFPRPDCSGLSCQQEANRDYQEAFEDWAASEANNAARRSYSVTYNHLRLGIHRGQTLGGGRVVEVSHSVGRTQPGQTVVNVVKAL